MYSVPFFDLKMHFSFVLGMAKETGVVWWLSCADHVSHRMCSELNMHILRLLPGLCVFKQGKTGAVSEIYMSLS